MRTKSHFSLNKIKNTKYYLSSVRNILGWQEIFDLFSKNNKTINTDVDLELEIKISGRELRLLLLHEFHLGCKATQATSNIWGTMGKDVLSIRTARRWFNQFKNGNFELDDLPHYGRSLEMDIDVLKQLIEEDPRLNTRCLAEQLGFSHTTEETHLGEVCRQ
jgi:hypothetical protein